MKIFFLLLVFSVLLNAQVTFQPTYNLSNTGWATSDYHSTFYGDNKYYVVWGDNGEIKYKYSNNFGVSWTSNVTISSTANLCGWPVVAAYQNNVYVLYHEYASNYQVIFQRSTDNGLTWSAMQPISGITPSGAITPQIVVNGNEIYAVFEERISNKEEIFFMKSNDKGTTWSARKNLSNTLSLTSRWVQLQMQNDILYCAYIEMPSYPLGDIFLTKSTDKGNTWTTPYNINNDARPQNRFYMKTASPQKLFIVSDDIMGSYNYNFDELFFYKSMDGGNTWTTPQNITNNPGHSNTPSFEVFGSNIYLAWSDNSLSAPAYDNSDIIFKWSSDEGNTWRDSINLSNNPETSSRPRFCFKTNIPLQNLELEFSVIWYDYSTGDAEILARNGVHQIGVPVELNSFSTSVETNNVLISWSTASEKNNKGFELLRKSSDTKWKRIVFIEGNGTSLSQNKYAYKDEELSAGKYFYRLEQVDFDGTREILKETEINIGAPDKLELLQNYPNPFNPSTLIQYRIPESQHVTVKVYDILGNEISTLVNEIKPAGTHNIIFNASRISTGIYIYRITTGAYSSSKQMLLIK